MLFISEGVKELIQENEVILVNLKTNSFIKIRKEAWDFLKKFIKQPSEECLAELRNTEKEAFLKLLTYLKEKNYVEDTSTCKEISCSTKELKRAFFESSRGAYYEITEYCNLKCIFCYANPKYKHERYNGNLELSKKILERAKEININRIVLSGGEPLLRKDIFEIIKYAKYKIGKVAITTNGTLIDEDIARRLKDSGIDSVSISIESFDKDIHDSLRGTGTFERCVTAIEALKKVGFDKSSINICATTTAKNLNGLSKFRKFANDLGVSMSFSFFQPAGRGKFHAELRFSAQEYQNFLVSLLDIVKDEVFQQMDISSSLFYL